MPVFRTKKEAFEWLKAGKKTVDVRKGYPRSGEVAVYLSGRDVLRMKILGHEIGRLEEIIRLDNYNLVIPSALTVKEAIAYLCMLYDGCDSIFTAYYVERIQS